MELTLHEQVRIYLRGKWDASSLQIINDMSLSTAQEADLPRLLTDLEDEGWIMKSFCKTHQHEEFDPGPAQDSQPNKELQKDR